MKKFLHNPITRSVIGGIIAYLIIGAISAIAERTGLWQSLLDLPGKIYHMKIPDFILVVFIIAILIALVLMNKKFKGLSPKEFGEMKADNERMQKHNEKLIKSANNIIAVNEKLEGEIEGLKREISGLKLELKKEVKSDFEKLVTEFEGMVQPKKERKIEIKNEHILVLSMLANTSGTIEQEAIFNVYRSNFTRKQKKDFKFIINDLEENELIEIAEGYKNGECYYRITSEGLHILKESGL